MNQPQPFNLIDGTFTPAEAALMLHALVRSKIDYHSLEKLSNEERFGEDRANSEKRLVELRKLDASLKALLEMAAAEQRKLKIDGWIEISFADERTARVSGA